MQDSKKLYKVVIGNDSFITPYRNFKFELGKEYHCDNFNDNHNINCAAGFYSTEIEGLIYTWLDFANYRVIETENWGRNVKYDIYKWRWEYTKGIRVVPIEEIKALALAEEERIGYKLSEALFPIRPFQKDTIHIGEKDIDSIKKYGAVLKYEFMDVMEIITESVNDKKLINILENSFVDVFVEVSTKVKSEICHFRKDKGVYVDYLKMNNALSLSSWIYIASMFPNIKKWGDLGDYASEAFMAIAALWRKGIIVCYDGNDWYIIQKEKITKIDLE